MKRIAALAGALLLTACTTTSQMQLAPDRAILTTRGNAFTTPEKVQHDMLLEAAKMAQAQGYEWFVIDGSRDVTTSGVLMTPASGTAYASGNASGWSGSAQYTGADYMPYTKPGMAVSVRFGRGPRPDGAIDAAFILAQVAKH